MKFNLSKCKVLHISSNNDRSNNSVNGSDLLEINDQKGLEATISSDFKHVSIAQKF